MSRKLYEHFFLLNENFKITSFSWWNWRKTKKTGHFAFCIVPKAWLISVVLGGGEGTIVVRKKTSTIPSFGSGWHATLIRVNSTTTSTVWTLIPLVFHVTKWFLIKAFRIFRDICFFILFSAVRDTAEYQMLFFVKGLNYCNWKCIWKILYMDILFF